MGSEKKRRRSESELERSERKRLKKVRKDAISTADDATDGATTDNAPDVAADTINDIPALVSPIASPMAGKKLAKKLFKTIGHAAKEKAIRRGVKEVVLALRKDEKGVVVLAGDVFPVEVICHIPVLCEEANVPYCFVSRKTELGAAGLTKRPTSVVLISEKKGSDDVKAEVTALSKDVQAIQNLY